MLCSPIETINAQNVQAAEACAYDLALSARKEGMRPLVIIPTYELGVGLKHRWAKRGGANAEGGAAAEGGVNANQGCGVLGIEICTLDAWARDLWELFGDGRRFVDPITRELLLSRALKTYCADHSESALVPTAGTRQFLAEVAAAALSRIVAADADEPALPARADCSLNEGEREVALLLAQYRSDLNAEGYIEMADALDLLRQEDAAAGQKPILLGFEPDELSCVAQEFCAAAGAVQIINTRTVVLDDDRAPELAVLLAKLYQPDEAHPVEETGALRFALSSGRYASARLLADTLIELVLEEASGSIVVAAYDPIDCAAELAPRLAQEGLSLQTQGSLPFQKTAFGAAWLALLDAVFADDPLAGREATDYALSAYAGVTVHRAYRMDAYWRARRLFDRDSALTDLAGCANNQLNGVVGLVENGDALAALDLLRSFTLKQSNWPEGYRATQLAVISQAYAVHESAQRLGLDAQACRSVLEARRVPLHLVSTAGDDRGDDRPRISVMSLKDAAKLDPASCDCLVVSDLRTSAYSAKDDEGAAFELLTACRVALPRDGLSALRRSLYDALLAARRVVVLARELNDEDGNEERPAVVFEDVLDCYRRNLQDTDELDKSTGLPMCLLPFASLRGEQNAIENLSPAGKTAQATAEVPIMPTGFVTPAARDKIVLPQQRGGVVYDGKMLSPSAIESYLECPYKWFAHRRLRLESLDAGFGGKEFGLFAHRVLDRFYERFQETCAPKVTPELLTEARSLLSQIFDAELEADAARIGDACSLVPLDDLERREVEDLRQKLLSYLEREARLLSDFAPLAAEVSFGYDKGRSFEYAGFMVNGTIDRVDVDGFGHAVILDYKGSVDRVYAVRGGMNNNGGTNNKKNGGHEEEAFALPRKVQALIYAQAVRKTLGLTPVGALYLSYGKDEGIAGAYDHRALHPERDLLGISAKNCSVSDFCELLDRVEEALAPKLARLLEGDIEARPRDDKACEYCPVTVCSARESLQHHRTEGRGA